nr:hypothetical protein [Candidatus Sigynarchaeota archaeon]
MPMVKLIAEFKPENHDETSAGEDFDCEIMFPSTAALAYFKKSEIMPAVDFITTAIKAMHDSNDRVIQKYGFGCSSCMYYEKELRRILRTKNISTLVVTIKDIQE